MTQVCLVIAGSKSNSDWLSNLRCANVDITARECSRDLPDVDPDRVVSVHAGIWAAAVNMDKRCLDLVTKALAERPGWPLVLCGHSLGAGTASLLGMRWRAMGVFPALHVYAFATPPTVDCAKIVADSHSYITAFQCGDDFVTRWCLGTTLDIAKVGHALASEEGVVDELIDVSLYGFRDAATGTCCTPLVRVRLRTCGCARAVARERLCASGCARCAGPLAPASASVRCCLRRFPSVVAASAWANDACTLHPKCHARAGARDTSGRRAFLDAETESHNYATHIRGKHSLAAWRGCVAPALVSLLARVCFSGGFGRCSTRLEMRILSQAFRVAQRCRAASAQSPVRVTDHARARGGRQKQGTL